MAVTSKKGMKINHFHLFMLDLHIRCVHIAYLIRFRQNLKIGTCGVVGNAYPEIHKQGHMFYGSYIQSEIANHTLNEYFMTADLFKSKCFLRANRS